MGYLVALLLVICSFLPLSAEAQSWPNEPAGAAVQVDCNFDSMLCGYSGDSGGGSIVSDSTAPLSPSSVVQFLLPTGTSNGGGEIIYNLPTTDNFYEGFWWKPSNPFEGHPNCANKVAGMFMTDGNLLMDMLCTQGTPGGPYVLGMVLEIPYNNCHLNGWGDCPGSFNLYPNRSSGSITLGTWHRVEMFMKRGASGTSRDAIIRVWLDGQIIMDYTNVNMPGLFTNTYFTPTWDGSWIPVHPTPFSHRYDHVRISTGGTIGGSDTTPPPQVTGLAAQPQSTSVLLTWSGVTDNSGIPVTYQIERCQGTSCNNFALIDTTQNTTTTHSGLTASTTYRWRVRAVDSSGNLGQYSSIVTATTGPPGGSNTTISITTNGRFALNGISKFLLGVSYYDCNNWFVSDVDSYTTNLFNLYVCHADDVNAGAFTNSLYNTDGSLRATVQNNIQSFISYVDSKGGVVDINCLYADIDGSNSAVHLTTQAARTTAVTNCVNAFKGNSNVIFSVVNEHNLGAFARTEANAAIYYNAARAACATCIITYSSSDTNGATPGDGLSHLFTTQTGSTVNTTTVDAELANNINILTPHNNRQSGWHLLGTSRTGNLRSYLDSVGALGIPVYLEEDAREGSGGTGVATDYVTYAQDVKLAGGAGFVFHTASKFTSAAAFTLHTAVETSVITTIGQALADTTRVVRDTAVHTNACAGTAADIGADWDAGYTDHNAWQTVADRCRTAGINLESLETYSGTIDANQWIEVDVPTFALSGTYTEVRAQVRMTAPATVSGYECRAGKITADTIRITRKDNNIPTTLASTTNYALTAPFVFACEVIGSTITAYLNGVAVLSAADTMYASGRPGVYGYSDASATDVEIDNIELGNFTTLQPVAPAITEVTVTITGATVTTTGSPAYIRVYTDLSNVVEPISSFPSGVYTRTWLAGETFVCFFARDANQVENTDPDEYQCRPTVVATDTTPPVISNPLPTGTLVAGTTSTTISITTNETAVCRYSTTNQAYGSMGSTFTTPNGLIHSATITGLVNSTSYTYYTRCQDTAGNPNLTSTSIAFSVDTPPAVDTTPPGTVTNFSHSILSTTQVRFTWTAVVDDVLTDHYNIYNCALNDCSTDGTIFATPDGSPHILSNLTPGANYNFAIKAVDSSGNVSVAYSTVLVVTMPTAGGDTIPPTTPHTIKAQGQPFNRVKVQWGVSTDASGILAYRLERCTGVGCTDFTPVKVTPARYYTDTTVVAGQTYRYRVVAIDNANNVGGYSTIVTVRVPKSPTGRDGIKSGITSGSNSYGD